MRGVGIVPSQSIVQSSFRIGEDVPRNGNSGVSQTRRPNTNEKRFVGLPPFGEIVETFLDEISARKRFIAHNIILTPFRRKSGSATFGSGLASI